MASTVLGKVTITPRGEYDPGTVYESLDVISFNGSSYLVKKMCIGVTPPNTEFFMILAEKGEDGNGSSVSTTIKIGTVTTGDPGTNASITNSGTETDMILDFVIPRGNDGNISFATFDIDASTGELSINIPDNNQDILFDIDENGYLEVDI